MSTTTTIKVGESAKTILLPEGKTMIITGSAGAAGVAYLLDPLLGGANSLRSWAVGAGSLAPIGGYVGAQKVLIVCTAGEIGAEVRDAVIAVAAQLAPTRKNLSLGQRIFIGSTTPPAPTDGLAHTFDSQHPAKRSFFAARAIFENLSTTSAMNINAIRIGSAPKHLMSYGDEITWYPNLVTTKGQTTLQIAMARAGITTDHSIQNYAITDATPLRDVPRTDSATHGNRPLTRCRARIPAEVQYPYNTTPALVTAWNAYAGNGGLKIGSYLTNSDFATAPPTDHAYTVTENGGFINPVAMIYSYVIPGTGIVFASDSLVSGVGTSISSGIFNGVPNGILGFPLLVHCQAEFIDTINLSVPGRKTADSLAQLANFLSVLDENPALIGIKNYTPNDGVPTQALIDTTWGMVLPAISSAHSKGIGTVLMTSPPVNGWSAAAHGFNEQQNARARALAAQCPWIIVLDLWDLWADPVNRRQLRADYDCGDHLHVNDLAHQAAADRLMSLIG